MKIQKIYTALLASDLPRAEQWYIKLLGREPDFRPMATLVQWELNLHGGIQLVSDKSLASHGAMSLIVDDVEAERGRLDGLGILLEESFKGTYSTLAKVRDLDGNLIILATPPSPTYPPA